MINKNIRNIAIIAHVDHGKTSLVNEMLKQGHVFSDHQVVGDRVMDSNDLERERGITILSKNASCTYKGIKINVVDTPGHADFGGEVERALKMVDGVLLVVDAMEGTMPQTRFVLEKALKLKLKVIVVINKIDRPNINISEVEDQVLELLMDLDATEEQLDAPFVYCSARQGVSGKKINAIGKDMTALFDTIVEYIPAPVGEIDQPFQMLVSSAEHNDFVGRLVIGKIDRGEARVGQPIALCNYHDPSKKVRSKIVQLFTFNGIKREAVEKASMGDIVCIAGIEEGGIGDTICDPVKIEPIEFVQIDKPTVEMTFLVNDSPFAGKEGKFVTSRHLRARLYKEAVKDLSLKVADGATSESFLVCGRGEMHLSILIENMRRDGYEFQVSMPRVLYEIRDGKRYEPIDKLVVDVPDDCVGAVMNEMGVRKGELTNMTSHNSRVKLEFLIPTRGLFGFKSNLLTLTCGEGIMSSVFYEYQEYKGYIRHREQGSLIAYEAGTAVPYGLFYSQNSGELFISPSTPVYGGMIVGQNPKGEDIVVNVCKTKHLTNCRASGSDDALRLTPPRIFSLEAAIEFLNDDEYLEITPKTIRMRKIILNHDMRLRELGRKKRMMNN